MNCQKFETEISQIKIQDVSYNQNISKFKQINLMQWTVHPSVDIYNFRSVVQVFEKLWWKHDSNINSVKLLNSISVILDHVLQTENDQWISCDKLYQINAPFIKNIKI